MRFARVAVGIALSIAFVAACKNSTGSSGGGHSNTITISNNSFNPTPDTVSAADSVTFNWVNASNSHNVTWLSGPGTLPANSATKTTGTYKVKLDPGSYSYHCTIHSSMNGTIVAQ